MARIIILEDEQVLREELADYLNSNGHQAAGVSTIAAFYHEYEMAGCDIAIIDLGLPDGDGLDVIAWLREQGSPIGIIVLTARGQNPVMVSGLELGADHFLVKPFRLNALLGVINALSRRLDMTSPDGWTLNISRRELISPAGNAVPLSARDYAIMRALVEDAGETVTRKALVEALGGDYTRFDQRRLDTQMRRLRKKVFDQTQIELPVNTVHSIGYVFSAPVSLAP